MGTSETKEVDLYVTVGLGSLEGKQSQSTIKILNEEVEEKIERACEKYAPESIKECKSEMYEWEKRKDSSIVQFCKEEESYRNTMIQQQQMSLKYYQQQPVTQQQQQQQQMNLKNNQQQPLLLNFAKMSFRQTFLMDLLLLLLLLSNWLLLIILKVHLLLLLLLLCHWLLFVFQVHLLLLLLLLDHCVSVRFLFFAKLNNRGVLPLLPLIHFRFAFLNRFRSIFLTSSFNFFLNFLIENLDS